MNTTIYLLRHASPASGEIPNRIRPLSTQGRADAQSLIGYLMNLNCSAVYSSPFARAVETIEPFCKAKGLPFMTREDLSESTAEEPLPDVRDRMIKTVSSIAASHPGDIVLICTHGGNLWGLITQFDRFFGYEDYRQIRWPDMRRLVSIDGKIELDASFSFSLHSPE